MNSIGVVTPHAAAGPELELPEMAPGEVAVQVSRILPPGATGASDDARPPTTGSGLQALTGTVTLAEAGCAVVACGVGGPSTDPDRIETQAVVDWATTHVVGTALLACLRRSDFAGRFGGEEFLMCSPTPR